MSKVPIGVQLRAMTCRMLCSLSRNLGRSLKCSLRENLLEAVTVIALLSVVMCLTCAFHCLFWVCSAGTGTCYECLVCVCADTLGAYSSGELAEKLSAAGVDAHV